uniref:WAP domain-containing protein n=1 Tax=Strix occidentalis caurina TaxID=311401 RepID=A0A8D0L0H6_STROC
CRWALVPVLGLPGRAPACASATGSPTAPWHTGSSAVAQTPLRPPGLYCLSDRSCPGAEKCCHSGQVRTCLLPTTGTPRETPAWGRDGGWDVGGGW